MVGLESVVCCPTLFRYGASNLCLLLMYFLVHLPDRQINTELHKDFEAVCQRYPFLCRYTVVPV